MSSDGIYKCRQSKGQLLVCDYMNNRINVFNSDYTFYKSIIIQGRIKRHIFAPTISEIIMYNGMAPPLGAYSGRRLPPVPVKNATHSGLLLPPIPD